MNVLSMSTEFIYFKDSDGKMMLIHDCGGSRVLVIETVAAQSGFHRRLQPCFTDPRRNHQPIRNDDPQQ